MKSIILCAGKGTRSGNYESGKNKCLTAIYNYGIILDYSLKTASELTDEIIVLLGYKAADVRRYVENYAKSFNKKILFAEQHELSGICQGLLCCASLLDGEDFLLFLGDEILTAPAHKTMIEDFVKTNALAACGFVYADNPDDVKRTYSLMLSGNIVVDIEEKPSSPCNTLMGTGNCAFQYEFIDLIRGFGKQNMRGGGEVSFPHILKAAITNGETVIASEIGKSYLNFNTEKDIKVFLNNSKR